MCSYRVILKTCHLRKIIVGNHLHLQSQNQKIILHDVEQRQCANGCFFYLLFLLFLCRPELPALWRQRWEPTGTSHPNHFHQWAVCTDQLKEKKKKKKNITIPCHHIGCKEKKTSVAGGAAVPGVVHYTSSTANGIYWFIGRNVNLWSRHSRGRSIRVCLKTNKRFRSNPEVSVLSERRLHGQEGEEKHFF